MNAPAASASLHTPRYVQLAQTLLNEIGSGRYPVGTQLPTEFELCEQFGVSRSTAREALKRLSQLGLVVRQPRVGTTVRAIEPNSAYRHYTAGVADLYRYATDTTLVIESNQLVCLDAQHAEPLSARAGETWLYLTGRRLSPQNSQPLCLTHIWVNPAFRAVKGLKGRLKLAVHAAIEQQFGEVITAVEQEIRAVALDRETAQALDAPASSPGLWISRRYRNRLGQLVEWAHSTHPAERFSYTTVLQREWGTGPTP